MGGNGDGNGNVFFLHSTDLRQPERRQRKLAAAACCSCELQSLGYIRFSPAAEKGLAYCGGECAGNHFRDICFCYSFVT